MTIAQPARVSVATTRAPIDLLDITVLSGGPGLEREVSLQSGCAVGAALDVPAAGVARRGVEKCKGRTGRLEINRGGVDSQGSSRRFVVGENLSGHIKGKVGSGRADADIAIRSNIKCWAKLRSDGIWDADLEMV